MRLTAREQRAIDALKEVAKIWPKSLWLFSANGTLNVMKTKDDGSRGRSDGGGGLDQQQVITTIDIENDGGDW